MDESKKALRAAKRPAAHKALNSKTKTVAIEEEAFVQVEACARKLKLTKSRFASAAIAYFAESGLNPTAERAHNLATVAMKVGAESQAVQQRVDDVGNRLMSVLRAWEQQQYLYLQTVQSNLFNYLEQVETNLLVNQQSAASVLGNRLLVPLLEQSVRGTIDSYMTRALTERVYLKVRGKDEDEWKGQSDNHDQAREKKLHEILREVAKLPELETPLLTPLPQVVAAPTRGPVLKKEEG